MKSVQRLYPSLIVLKDSVVCKHNESLSIGEMVFRGTTGGYVFPMLII